MSVKNENQMSFSTLLFDTLFGLILFFNIDSFLEITSPLHFIFYLFTILIPIHWWLIFKSSDDTFDQEVSSSAVDLIFGLMYLILIEYNILMAKVFEYNYALWFLVALLATDLTWALCWRFVGHWKTKSEPKIKRMETDLNANIWNNLIFISLFVALGIVSFVLQLEALHFVMAYIVVYLGYIVSTFLNRIIDIKIF